MGRKTTTHWGTISDQIERRKAQNRLAQRKRSQYRLTSFQHGVPSQCADINHRAKKCREHAEPGDAIVFHSVIGSRLGPSFPRGMMPMSCLRKQRVRANPTGQKNGSSHSELHVATVDDGQESHAFESYDTHLLDEFSLSLQPISSQSTASISGSNTSLHAQSINKTTSQEHADPASVNNFASHVTHALPGMNTYDAAFEPQKSPILSSRSRDLTVKSHDPNNASTVNAILTDHEASHNAAPPMLHRAPALNHDSAIHTPSAISRRAEPSPRFNPHSASGSPLTPRASTPTASASPLITLEDRLQHVLSAARAMGFESLDMLLLQYYTQPLEHNACLLEIQRRSRRRDLRVLLNQLARSAQDWSTREAHGFEETVLAAAEGIVGREASEHLLAHGGMSSPALTEGGDDGLRMSHLRDEVRGCSQFCQFGSEIVTLIDTCSSLILGLCCTKRPGRSLALRRKARTLSARL